MQTQSLLHIGSDPCFFCALLGGWLSRGLFTRCPQAKDDRIGRPRTRVEEADGIDLALVVLKLRVEVQGHTILSVASFREGGVRSWTVAEGEDLKVRAALLVHFQGPSDKEDEVVAINRMGVKHIDTTRVLHYLCIPSYWLLIVDAFVKIQLEALDIGETAPGRFVTRLELNGQRNDGKILCRSACLGRNKVSRELGLSDLDGGVVDPYDVLGLRLGQHSQVGIVVVVCPRRRELMALDLCEDVPILPGVPEMILPIWVREGRGKGVVRKQICQDLVRRRDKELELSLPKDVEHGATASDRLISVQPSFAWVPRARKGHSEPMDGDVDVGLILEKNFK